MSTQDPRARLDTVTRRALLEDAFDLADVCASRIAEVTAAGVTVRAKTDTSLVTTADTEAEAAFRAELARRHLGHEVLGEEGGLSQTGEPGRGAEFRWVIDPIDGTAEFARGIPTYGTIIGLYFRGLPLAGVIDHPALGLRVGGAFGLGLRANGEVVSLAAEDPFGGGATGPRIGMPSRAGFVRRGNGGAVFEAVTRAYPECRTFHTCLSHAYALTGALDAGIEWDVPIWDLGALELLAAEAGAAYHTVCRRCSPNGVELLSAVFGRPGVADDLADLVRRILVEIGGVAC